MAKRQIFTHDEVWNIPLKQYTVIDPDGKKVVVNPKNPDHHSAGHPLTKSSTFFYNVGAVITDPDEVVPSDSNNPQAIAERNKGTIKVYRRKNFVTELNMPGYQNWKGDMTEVVVLYSNEEAEGNYTKTYILEEDL